MGRDGSQIPGDRPAELCAQCHTTVYSDWLAGVHGRRHGSWDPARGERLQLLCVQCHDPHSPKFPKLAAMPGPDVSQRDQDKIGNH